MSKPVHPTQIRPTRQERRRKQRDLREEQKRQGRQYPPTSTLPNRKSEYKTEDEEQEDIQQRTEKILDVYRQLLPGLLHKLARIPDPRSPKKVKHQMTIMMIYGILMFVFQMPSRRETNQEMTGPRLLKHLQAVFPELTDMPHQDTLCRLLEKMDVDQIEIAYIDMLRHLIYKKKFKNLLHQKRYLVAVDGTQKYVMDQCWDECYPHRRVQGKDGEHHQYYAYVLEAVLILSNGMVLPLMSEFLENDTELEKIESDEEWKQDCELKAFYRLATRLKKEFPRLRLTLLLDGLYANGPVIEICRKNKWQFMIVLKDDSLPSVWEEVNGLMRLDTKRENYYERIWQGRQQTFRWVNDIDYEYGYRRAKILKIHVVICKESWEEIELVTCRGVTKTTRYAWISSDPIKKTNIHARSNLIARKRWLQENTILKEKHQGYHYEHIFSHNWNAMKGYHYLMHIGRMLNEMVLHSVCLTEHAKKVGFRRLIEKFRKNMIYNSLDTKRIRKLMKSPGQLRLVQEDDWKIRPTAA
jgi:hypothetical protein